MNDEGKHPLIDPDFVERSGRRLEPSYDHVLVAKLPKDRLEKEGQIFVPGTAGRRTQVRNNWGQVLAIGPRVKDVAVGDVVHWGEYAGMDVKKDAHFDLSDEGTWLSLPDELPQDKPLAVLAASELDLCLTFEEGEPVPLLHDA